MERVLIVDDEISICKTLALHLKQQKYDVEWVNTAEEGLKRLQEKTFRNIILDVHLPDMDGLTALQKIRESGNKAHVIIVTAFHDLELPVKAMQYGAVEFIHKPIDIEELDEALKMFPEISKQKTNETLPIPQAETEAMVVGHSRAMKEIFKLVGMVSKTNSTVLIDGESGTGKELVACAIHNNTPNIKGRFVPVNCAAIVDTLLESDLFGHEKGAFTGAITSKEGRIVDANGGTFFLDEIGDMSLNLQAKLLRLLQERKFEKVGGRESLHFDGRIIAATNRNLEQEVEQKRFREDLFYRLNVVRIYVPPLRERREDIPILVNHLLNRINKNVGKSVNRILASTMAELVAYDWPGNIREMENRLTRAVVMAHTDTLQVDLPEATESTTDESDQTQRETQALRSIADVERQHIALVLQATNWHKGRTCEILGVSRPRLERKIDTYKLQRH